MTGERLSLGTLVRDIVRFRNLQLFVPARTEDLEISGVIEVLSLNPPEFCVVNQLKLKVEAYCVTWDQAVDKAEELNRGNAA
jgi:hypothetical protein